jgi:hypothetical protein
MTSPIAKPSDYLKALVCGIPTPLRKNRLFAMLVSYVDDSGSEGPEAKVFTLAGFIASFEKWNEFTDEWTSLCQKEPKTEDFKMKVAERLKGSNTYWGTGTEQELLERRDSKVMALTEVICKYAQYRISASMAWENYERFARNQVPKNIDNPYIFLFWQLIATILQAGEIKEEIEFIFDEQGGWGSRACDWYETIIPTLPSGAASLIAGQPLFRTDKKYIPLKAADLYAWHIRRHIAEHSQQNPKRQPLHRIESIHNINANIYRNNLIRIVMEINRGLEPSVSPCLVVDNH